MYEEVVQSLLTHVFFFYDICYLILTKPHANHI